MKSKIDKTTREQAEAQLVPFFVPGMGIVEAVDLDDLREKLTAKESQEVGDGNQ